MMNVSNTFDEVVLAATLGAVPSAQDIASVTPPPGKDREEYARELVQIAAEIAALRLAGANGPARAMAQQASADYLAAFGGVALVANSTPPATQAEFMTSMDAARSYEQATPAELAARDWSGRDMPATAEELAARVTSGRRGSDTPAELAARVSRNPNMGKR